ncbi:hypothetical protein NDU88_003373, partial [Pleurodeles waltl]
NERTREVYPTGAREPFHLALRMREVYALREHNAILGTSEQFPLRQFMPWVEHCPAFCLLDATTKI